MNPSPLKWIAWLVLSAMPFAALAQVAVKPYRIGIVLTRFDAQALASRSIPVQASFEEGLRELGWIDGRNVQLLYRGGVRGKDDVAVIEELVRIPVDALVVIENSVVEDAVRVTRTVPIVALMDLGVQGGVFKSLARPGGNVTGISMEGHGGLATKRLALLKEAAPIKRVARLYVFPDGEARFGDVKELLPEYAVAARALGLEVFPVFVTSPKDLRAALDELNRRGESALSVFGLSRYPGMEATWDALLDQVRRYRIPVIYDETRAADQGGLMSYGTDYVVRMRRLAYFVDRILKGTKPADIPVEQPSNASLVVNLGAARAIGLEFPSSIMLQADRVVP